MVKYCLDRWDRNKNRLKKALSEDVELNECEYDYLVKMTVKYILNEEKSPFTCDNWDEENITLIDNGDYQGTRIFVIPCKTYQPSEYEYLMTFSNYGSCSGCDTLLAIQNGYYNPKVTPTETQLEDYMTLCRDLVSNIVKPFNNGWREDKDFLPVEDIQEK